MSPLHRLVASVLVTGLAATACTETADVAPASSAVTLEPISTGPGVATTLDPAATVDVDGTDPDTAVDTAADTTVDTVAATSAPGSTEASTTTTAPVGRPTTVSTEYFLGGDPDGWLYLGRWTGNAWESTGEDTETSREPTAATGDSVSIHELDVDAISGAIEGSDTACASDGRTGPVISPNARALADPGFGYRAIAFAADWPAQPRTVATVDASVASYAAAGEAAFSGLGIDASGGSVEQTVVADLDGDGDTEALVAFGGDGFSTLLLIDTDSGASTTVVRSVSATATPTTVPGEEVAGTPPASSGASNSVADTYRTLAVVDLNGDGRSEIVVHSFADDETQRSAAVAVNTYDGNDVDAVLTAGC